jgi:ABC-type transport system involved in multi-copper enzyme maturation permease subunit
MTAVQSPPQQTGTGPAAAEAARRAPAVPLPRLILVELRKLADTRSGMWLLIVIVLASVATGLILLFAGDEPEQTFAQFFTFAQLPAGVLLPVLGILAMTSEWTQRTALTTFTLVPQRGRVVAAKLVAAIVIAVVAALSAFVFAAAFNLIAEAAGGDGSWTITWQLVAQCIVLQVLYVLMGSAFGALLMNSPLAIVTFFALPMVWTILGETVRALRTAAGWLDINLTTVPLTEDAMTAGQWGRLGVSAAVWVLLPLVLGTVRVLRREVA